MPCEVHSDPEIFEGARIFVCSADHAQPCGFCPARGLYVCDWPVERFELAKAHEVRHGDVVRSERVEMRVLGIEAIRQTLLFQIEVVHAQKHLRIAAYFRAHGLAMFESDPIFILRAGTCDRSICEAHAREVGEERHYCSSHWHAWQEVS